MRNHTQRSGWTAAILATVLLAIVLGGYVGAYFALVDPCYEKFVGSGDGPEIVCINYRCQNSRFAEQLFWPLEQIDRKIRPGIWPSEWDEALRRANSVARPSN